MRVSKFALLISAAFCFHSAFAQAPSAVRVETTTGQTWEGKVISETEKEVILDSGSGQFPIPRAVIKSMTAISAAPAAPPPAAAPAPVAAGLFRLHGSNTIGAQLGPDLATAFGKTRKMSQAHDEPGAKPDEKTVVMDAPESTQQLRAEIHAHGSGTAFTDMLAGKADIGMASRPVSSAEVEALKAAGFGDLTKPGNENVIAMDGITFLAHPTNTVKSLTLAQLHDLMSGAKTNWSEVGGPNLPIHVYSRDQKSGTFDLVKEKILTGAKLAPGTKVFESNEDLSDAVAADPSGLGFSGFAYIRNAKPIQIDGACGLAPSSPEVFDVKAEEYPLSRRLFLYAGDKRSPLVDEFLAFAIAPESNAIANNSGFVSLEAALAPQSYTQALMTHLATPQVLNGRDTRVERDLLANNLKGAQRLSITIRFGIGQSGLDSLAATAMDRLQFWLKGPGAGKQLILVGYSSADGDYGANVYLSRRRAAEIEANVRKLGVTATKSIGVGPIEPVACDGPADGPNLNRRVEIWAK